MFALRNVHNQAISEKRSICRGSHDRNYLAGVSVRRVEDITEALWGSKVSPSTISAMNQKIYGHIESWRNRLLQGEYLYVYLDMGSD